LPAGEPSGEWHVLVEGADGHGARCIRPSGPISTRSAACRGACSVRQDPVTIPGARMRHGSAALPVACLVALAAGCRQAQPTASPTAPPGQRSEPQPPTAPALRGTLVLSASTAGQLMPCGCSPDQRGGLPRAVAAMKKLRAEVPGAIYADAGDLLFESAVPRKGPQGAQAELKARTLARGEELLGAAARAVGARDLALGPQFVAETRGNVP